MGHDTTLIIGRAMYHDNQAGVLPIAIIDLAVMGYGSETFELEQNAEGVNAYFYSWDGNTRVTEDMYGKQLKVIELETMIAAMRKDAKSKYRRAVIALNTLKTIRENFSEGENVVALLYGH